MKILHTSDWHIGKKLINGRSRIGEQAEVLNEIRSICDSEGVDLVLIAGDVFDTFIPPAEAEELFFNAVNAIANENRAVVIISGNHDDSVRLCASSVIASRINVYVFGGDKVPTPTDFNVCAESTGKYHCVIKKGSERLYVGVLPYPSEQRFGERKNDLSFDEKMSAWINACFENNTQNLDQILVSHLFMLGGSRGESERQIELGGTRLVNKDLIPQNCLYTALGHLHKPQIIDSERNILYSGSILQYAFDEVGTEKGVNLFEVENGCVKNLKRVALTGGKRLAKLTAISLDDAKKLLDAHSDFYCSLTLKLRDVLTEEDSKCLASNYPQLVELKLEQFESDGSDVRIDRRDLSDEQLFVEYYKQKTGGEQPTDELLNLYLKFMGEEL